MGCEDVNTLDCLQRFGGTCSLLLHDFTRRNIVVLVFTVAGILHVKYQLCLGHKFYA